MYTDSTRRKEYLSALRGVSEIIVWDTETNDLKPGPYSAIVQLSAQKCKIDEHLQLEAVENFNTYLNWNGRVYVDGTKAGEVNGITDAMLRKAPSAEEVAEKWLAFCGDITAFAGYNSTNFDISFTTDFLLKTGHAAFNPNPHLDVIKMCKDVVEAPHYKLIDMAKHFKVDKGINFHDSFADVEATRLVMNKCIKAYLQMEAEEPKDLLVPTKITRMAYWPGYRGFSRIYADTDIGTFYYDIRKGGFGAKDIDEKFVDMGEVRKMMLRRAHAQNEAELAKFR